MPVTFLPACRGSASCTFCQCSKWNCMSHLARLVLEVADPSISCLKKPRAWQSNLSYSSTTSSACGYAATCSSSASLSAENCVARSAAV